MSLGCQSYLGKVLTEGCRGLQDEQLSGPALP